MVRFTLCGAFAWLAFAASQLSSLSSSGLTAAEPIARVLPPAGVDISPEDRQRLTNKVQRLRGMHDSMWHSGSRRADVEVYIKAVELALRHGEFYGPKDVAKADAALAEADSRLNSLAVNQRPWSEKKGLVVRGYQSKIDGSAQPYGLVIPESLDLGKPAPLYVWLHGRGDKQTDLHFIDERTRSVGQIRPENAIVVHPFGRHCLGFKSAGEIDVLETVHHVMSHYKIDPRRVVLMGFSMGGAGAWHLGAHYADHWCAISPGAGFAETAKYNRLTPEKYPAAYVQQLWGCYDVPDYVRNLFNRPVLAYSGENDKQIQAARVMEEAYAAEGRQLEHLIGPGVEHKYEPATLAELLRRIAKHVQEGRDIAPRSVSLQTRTLRYNRMFWAELLGLERHWEDTRLDAQVDDKGQLVATTRNVARFRLSPPQELKSLVIDGQTVALPADYAFERKDASVSVGVALYFQRDEERWTASRAKPTSKGLAKIPQLQGPIDDAFLDGFIVVKPSGKSASPQVDQWVQSELQHFVDRWRAVCRGEVQVVEDVKLVAPQIERNNIVVWGDPQSNQVLAQIADQLPVTWKDGAIRWGDESRPADRHVPVLIYPNPLNPTKYVVVNSGLTFREAHDRTNSQQNPKLPDWAVVDVTQPPDAESPGKIVDAGFFDEQWRLPRPAKNR